MKKLFLFCLLFLSVSLFFTNCELDDTVNTNEQTSENLELEQLTIRTVSYNDVGAKFNHLKAKYQLDTYMQLQDVTSRLRTTQDTLGITIDTGVIKEIILGNYTSYTMRIIAPNNSDTSMFYNITLEEKDGQTGFFVTKYTPTDNWLADTKKQYEGGIETMRGESFSPDEGGGISVSLSDFTHDGEEETEGGGGNDDCLEVSTQIEPCNQGGTHIEKYCCQHQNGIHGCDDSSPCNYICSGTNIVTIVDLSDCVNQTYNPPSGPSNNLPGGNNPNDGQLGNSVGDDNNESSNNTSLASPVPFEDTNCPPGSGKIKVNDVCVCPEGKVENNEGVCVCPDGYVLDNRNNCILDGHCFELDKLMFATQSDNPFIQDDNPHNETGENKHIRSAIINMQAYLDSNWEHGYAFYNRGNFPDYGPYAHYYEAQQQDKVHFPNVPHQYGTIHIHPINGEAIPMFSHDDIYSLLQIRNTYVNSGALLNNNNPAGDDLFVVMLTVEQAGHTFTYAIKINDINKLQSLEAIHQNKDDWEEYGEVLNELYTDNADGINGGSLDYQKTFLQFVKDKDLGLDLYKMEQLNVGTPEVHEVWTKLSLNTNGTEVEAEPCNSN